MNFTTTFVATFLAEPPEAKEEPHPAAPGRAVGGKSCQAEELRPARRRSGKGTLHFIACASNPRTTR